MIESRIGVSFSQASRGMVLRHADNDKREILGEPKIGEVGRESTSAAALALHSG